MNILERIQLLCEENNITVSKLEVELGLGKGTLYKWNKSSPNSDKLSQVADYFNVSVDWLLGKTEFRKLPDEEKLALDVQRCEDFSNRDKKDIAITMNFLLEQLDNYQEALMFDGEILDDETRDLLKNSLLNSLKMGKLIAKQKFTPDKYKKIDYLITSKGGGMDMNKIISKLVNKYQTRNPFELADHLGIIVLFEELGSINGYYNTAFRQKFIHINCNLPEHKRLFTAAHELGHALLHPNSNTPFLRERTYMSINKFEVEANKFAVNLLISDEDLEEYKELTTGQLAMIYGCHESLIQLRVGQHKFKIGST